MAHKKTKNIPTTATARLKQDYMRLKKDPIPFVIAEPSSSNILEWHYVVRGPNDTPYAGGLYHGKLVFPREFPFKPPSIYMITPSGRFKCNTRLCLSISDFHPDTWNPAWSVGTILTGLLSFMVEDSETLGSIKTSLYAKRQHALNSGRFNLKNSIFCEIFPEIVTEINRKENTLLNEDKFEDERKSEQYNESNQNKPKKSILNFTLIVGLVVILGIIVSQINTE